MNGLGDTIHNALSTVSIIPQLVSKWLGKPCGCEERQQKLNVLGQWASRVVRGKTENAIGYLKLIMGGDDDKQQ